MSAKYKFCWLTKTRWIPIIILIFFVIIAGCASTGETGRRGAQGDKGDKGDTGNWSGSFNFTGVNGTSSTIDVNYTFTGEEGTLAAVINIGNSTNALLDFTIPTGLSGSNGTNGINGTIPDLSEFYLLNGTRILTGVLNAGGFNLSNLLNPISNQDAATKYYVDTMSMYNASYITSTYNATYDATTTRVNNNLNNWNATYNATYDAKVSTSNTSYVLTNNASYVLVNNASYALISQVWTSYTPTFTWSINPSNPSGTGRWMQIGKVVYWQISYFSSDSNAGVLQTFTLPKTMTASGIAATTGTGFIQNTNLYTVSTANAYIGAGTPTVCTMANFPTTLDGQVIAVYLSGFYEVTT